MDSRAGGLARRSGSYVRPDPVSIRLCDTRWMAVPFWA